jgi:hypothetical protein
LPLACFRPRSYLIANPANQGTQAFGGNLAFLFDVNSPVTVTGLGVFNAAGDGVIHGTIDVDIFNTTSNALVTPIATFQGTYTPIGFDVFQSITPVVLPIGTYEVDAVGFNSSDLNGNLSTGSTSGAVLNNDGGKLTFTGASYDFSSVLDDPQNSCAGCFSPPDQFHQWDAGAFVIGNATATPEPRFYGVLGIGLASLMVLVRRKRVS